MVDTFETATPPNPLFCHQEFLEKLAEHDRDSVGKRAAFLLQRMCVDARRLHYKSTQGVNRGWRRSRLGGNHGSHFYAWWAPKNALPLKENDGFSQAPEGSIFLRDIRHHDDHSPLTAQSLESSYLPLSVKELRQEEYTPLPWTQPQLRFATARQMVRLLKGYPGSGKTSALLNAADASGAGRVLYITYSRDLAALAREYFDRFCSSHKRFQVVTFPNLVRQALGLTEPPPSPLEAKQRFLRDVSPMARSLGPWTNHLPALYEELYAHLIGDALPIDLGRFKACARPRVSEKAYRERRNRYLGEGAASSALEAVSRLEKLQPDSLAQRYFPELALAWSATEHLRSQTAGRGVDTDASLLDFDCVAVDECQDLTPLESFFLVALASQIGNRRRAPVPLLMSGDEAQTVRPTDFEWGWLSDILHSQLSTPSEYKLAANLRSPHRIAELVNRVWDLYAHLQKHERPSGTGYAEIEDDASDQVLYCSAAPGPELNELLSTLSTREGLALITLDDEVPASIPEPSRNAVLTVPEAKGLDFNSVCLIDAGKHLARVIQDDSGIRSSADIERLRKRLTIDQLRVALSRPTERLFWLDISPTEEVVRCSLSFLNSRQSESGVSSCVPSALLKTLEEDELDLEERVQRCQSDARQFLEARPEVAWSRAQQAVTLLGRPGSLAAVTDQAARDAAFLTLAEVCCILGLRNVRLAPELGRPDLFQEAARAAINGSRTGLSMLIEAIGKAHRAMGETRLHALAELARLTPSHKNEIEPWLMIEMQARAKGWLDELEAAVYNAHNAAILAGLLPSFYQALDLADAQARAQRLRQRVIQLLMKDRQFAHALSVLSELAERQPKLEAACREGLGDFRGAAESHIASGNLKEALQCYRSVPDLEAALKLIDQMGDHPASATLRWMAEMQQLAEKRPDKFTKTILPAEKKLLEEILERSLGVTRRKAAVKKAAVKKAVAKKAVVKKTASRKSAPPRPPLF